eukprot:TRINITY_DN7458_c0_g1_i3.p1 TRINITY_DN7458_c0_g1~~TRINITY_DN7458_c0_g1_i3.p1  ORF type:complete len:244 (-),score=36.42 TRINITY_DN7458_c0_g1_i3:55-786(-)
MDIFVLSGQSNMAGRGGVVNSRWDHNVPPECQPNPSIFRLDADLQWSQANEPLHIDIDTNKACGIGPGMVFANTVLEHYKCRENARIGLVPCAIGGTAIREWERGSLLYNNMISRTNEALKNGVLRAILWYQGESDTLSEDTANSYKENLEKLICDIRSDLKQPNLLFIQVAVNMEDQAPPGFVNKVREAQLSISMPNVYTVDAKGLLLLLDNLHLTSEAQLQLGKMLANEYIKHGNTQQSNS